MRRLLCFPLAALLAVAAPLTAQTASGATTSMDARGKSPTAARVIGIIPGAGHMYAGETTRGFAYLGGVVGVLLVGGTALAVDCVGDLSGGEDCGSPILENVVTAAALGLWGYSIYDAGRAAHRTNAARGLRTSFLIAPSRRAALDGHPVRTVKVGLSFSTP